MKKNARKKSKSEPEKCDSDTHEKIEAAMRSKKAAIWKRAKRIHAPVCLKFKWSRSIDPNPSVEKFVSDLRENVLSPQLDNPETAPAYVARFMESFLQRFGRLVQAGKLDAVLPRLSELPVLYSLRAGTGAGGWEHAAELFKKKHVGRECPLPYRTRDSKLARNATWRHLAHDTVWIIQQAVLDMPVFQKLRKSAAPFCRVSQKISEKAESEASAEIFRLPKMEFLVWPDWLDACEAIPTDDGSGLPVPVKKARTAYLKAARVVLDNFFADPDNAYANAIVAKVKGMRSLHRANAVAEARKNIIAAIRGM